MSTQSSGQHGGAARTSGPAFHIVLGIATFLSLPQLWNFVNNQANLSTTLFVCLGALVLSWMGCMVVKTVVTRYLPPDQPYDLEPYGLTGGPTYQPPPGVVPNGNGSGTPGTPAA